MPDLPDPKDLTVLEKAVILDVANEIAHQKGLPAMNRRVPIPTDLPPMDKEIIKDLDGISFKSDPYKLNSLSLSDQDELYDEISVQLKKRIDLDSGRNQDIDRYNDIYLQKKKEKSFPWPGCSNIATGAIGEFVETLVAQMDKGILEVEPVIPVEPTEDADYETAKKQEIFLHKHNSVIDPIGPIFRQAFRNTAIEGNAIVKVMFDYKVEKKRANEHYESLSELSENYINFRDVQKDNPQIFRRLSKGKPVDVQVEYDDEVRSNPVGKIVLLKNFYTDAMIDFDDANYLAERITVPYSLLEKRWEDKFYFNKDRFDGPELGINDKIKRYENHDIFEIIWKGRLPGQKDVKKYIITLSLDKACLLRVEDFPYNHGINYYINIRILEKQNTWRGMGLVEMTENPIQVMEDVFNQQIDANTIANAPIIAHLKRSNISELTHPVMPLARWPLNSLDEIQIIKMPDPSFQNNTIIQSSRFFAQSRCGITDNAAGKDSLQDPNAPGNKTVALLNQALIRIDLYTKTVKQALSQYAYLVLQDYYEYMPRGMDFLVVNPEDGKSIFEGYISGEEMSVKANYFPRVQNSVYNRQLESTSLMQLYQIMVADPAFANLQVQRREVVKRWLALNNIKGINDLIPSEREIQAQQVEIQKQALLQAQAEQNQMQEEQRKQLEALKQEEESVAQYEEQLKTEGAMEALEGDRIERDQEKMMGQQEGMAIGEILKASMKDEQ